MSKVETMSQQPQIPEGMNPDARETWPSPELIESWLGDSVYDLHLGPGDDVAVPGDDPVGMTCQSFSSVSLDPPLVMFVPAKTSRAWPMIQRAGRFCVNVLSAEQAGLSNQMASRGVDKFAGVDWTPSRHTGSPVLTGTLAHIDCTVHAVHEAGDHYVVIGRALDLQVGAEGSDPLLFFRGQYRTTAPD
jgi:3-hydroxy-9,10-secoandrosta-1,3,5(10)-triene-9,17-dione monooxygenase reductase component